MFLKIKAFEKTYYKSEQTHILQKDRQVINVQKLHNLNIWDPLDFLLWTLSTKKNCQVGSLGHSTQLKCPCYKNSLQSYPQYLESNPNLI